MSQDDQEQALRLRILQTPDRAERRELEHQLDLLRGYDCTVCGARVAEGEYHDCCADAYCGGY